MLVAALLVIASLGRPVVPPQPSPQPPVLTQSPSEPGVATAPSLPLHCVHRQPLVNHLRSEGGKPLFVGIINQSFALEVWRDAGDPANPWLAFMTLTDGAACIFAQGSFLGFVDPNPLQQPDGMPLQFKFK